MPKRYSSFKSRPKVLKLLLNFLPNGPHKTTFGIFEILKMEILMNFIRFRKTWDAMGVNISKSYSSYKSQPKILKLVLNFPLNGDKTSFVFCFFFENLRF